VKVEVRLERNPAAVEATAAVASVGVGGAQLTIENVVDVAAGRRAVALNREPAFIERIARGAAFLRQSLEENATVYGVNTGYGDSCVVSIPPELVEELPAHLVRYHGCGAGALFDERATLAVLAARLNSLARGFSGVRFELLEGIERLINYRVLPCVPSEGSVGASGDLTPLSYVAAALMGEREVSYRGAVRPAAEVLRELGLEPFRLAPKEGLAIMNGTAVMTALACLAWDRAEYLSRLAARIASLAALAMHGNREHFHPALFEVKPHAGQGEAAAWIYADMAMPQPEAAGARLQDRYSIRCAPHVIGVLRDALTWLRRDIENELNSANDNPIVDAERRLILHGGHFYGGHIAFAMDSLKAAVASVADLMDRQMALLVDAKFNHGLPQNLSGARPERASINHGFKGVQISVSAWTAEAAQADDAGGVILPLHRVAQPGQGEHGHDRRARLPAGARADRAGRGGDGARDAAGSAASQAPRRARSGKPVAWSARIRRKSLGVLRVSGGGQAARSHAAVHRGRDSREGMVPLPAGGQCVESAAQGEGTT
jgi:histidine ammonia-lyase